jgi:hypothetical protein
VLVLVLELNAGVVSEVYMSDLLASSRGLRLVALYTKPSSTSTIWLTPPFGPHQGTKLKIVRRVFSLIGARPAARVPVSPTGHEVH